MSRSLAIPVAIGTDGTFVRESLSDAVAHLIGVMAATEAGFWAHAPWFGVRQELEGATPGKRDVPRADEAISEALRQLGLTGVTVRIEQVQGDHGAREFAIHIREDGATAQVRRIHV